MINRLTYIKNKIVDPSSALKRISTWKMKSDKIVFTNGCFDILHMGHVTYLASAAQLGNRLVVALNTDSSVKRQGKGENRPINDENARSLVLAALGYVDLVVLFDSDTPLELIKLFKPDVLAKGADYDSEELDETSAKYIIGSKEVKAIGGNVVAIPLVQGYSTTALIEKANKH